MFGLGLIKGSILGITLGLISSVVIKKICNKNKKSYDKKVDSE